MKNNKLLKVLSILAIAIMLFAILTLPVCADETTTAAANTSNANPQIQINPDFDANQTIRAVFNWIVGILAIIGAGVGGFHIVMGQLNQDPKERNGGIIALIISLAAGGLMLTILNMVLK